ncbi:hypothetical protein [Aliidiomarina celeris]|uniref:hypothetical protein n=1 Tax=Aliidiomarina celeris TaxID=2249428 RepID=UPI000DEA1DB4|nr:hypothetical protein [Aliidiomarina celeris]
MKGLKLLFACLMMLLVGCQTPLVYEQAEAEAQARLAAHRALESTPNTSPHIVREQGYFVPPLNLPSQSGPAWMQLPVHFAFEDYPLGRALQDLLAPEGISVRVLDDIDREQRVTLRLQGTLGDALTQLAMMTGLSFEATDQLVVWRQFEVAEFDVAFLAGETNFFLGQEAGSTTSTPNTNNQMVVSGAGVNDDSSQYLNFVSEQLSVWQDLENALTLLLSTEGSLAINQSSTSILVRDYPQHVQLVREYILQQNERLTRQVSVDIQVIDVTFLDNKQTGIDWNLVHEATNGSGVLNLFNPAGANQFLQRAQGALYQRGSGKFAGSELLIAALQEQGVVEVSNHPRMVSLNNQISKVVLEENVTYLASAGSSSTANVGSNDLLIPGVVRTGFELYLLPKISNQQVLLQLSTSLSDLKGIDEVSSGETTIQTPQTSRKKFFMKAIVQNQETLLITGLQNTRNQWKSQQGILPWLFGGQRSVQRQHVETIVLLTPRILNSGNML